MDWKSNKNTTNQVNKNNPITVNKSATPLLANKSLTITTNSETAVLLIPKSDVKYLLPIEQNSIGKSPRGIKSFIHLAQPKDSARIQKIAVLKQKTNNRFARLVSTTLFTFLTLKIIDFFDGDDSDWSNAYVFALLFFCLSMDFTIVYCINHLGGVPNQEIKLQYQPLREESSKHFINRAMHTALLGILIYYGKLCQC